MKFFIVLLALTAVLAVPVTQVPEEKKDAPVVAEPVVAGKEPVVSGKEPVVSGKEPVVSGKEPVVSGKEPVVSGKEPTNNEAVPDKKITSPEKSAPAVEEVKGQALSQIMKAFTDLAGPFKGEEFSMLKDVMEKGQDILSKAEEKAKEIHSHPEFQNLVQADSLFGIKNDGTIDADVATEQLTQLMNMLTGSPLSTQEKTLVHDLIGGFSSLFAPSTSTDNSMNADLEKLATQFTAKFDKMQQKLTETPKDKLFEPQTLLSVMSEEDGSIDTQLLSQVTEKFMDKITAQFDKVMGSFEKLQH